MELMELLGISLGVRARQFTNLLLSLLSHIGEMVGRHGFAPCSIRVRAGASLSKVATRARREGGVKPPQPGQQTEHGGQAAKHDRLTGVLRLRKTERAASSPPGPACGHIRRS